MQKPLTALEAFTLHDRAAAIVAELSILQHEIEHAANTTPIVADDLHTLQTALKAALDAFAPVPDTLYSIHRELYIHGGIEE